MVKMGIEEVEDLSGLPVHELSPGAGPCIHSPESYGSLCLRIWDSTGFKKFKTVFPVEYRIVVSFSGLLVSCTFPHPCILVRQAFHNILNLRQIWLLRPEYVKFVIIQKGVYSRQPELFPRRFLCKILDIPSSYLQRIFCPIRPRCSQGLSCIYSLLGHINSPVILLPYFLPDSSLLYLCCRGSA